MPASRFAPLVLACCLFVLGACGSGDASDETTVGSADPDASPRDASFEGVPECPTTGVPVEELAGTVPAEDGPEGTLLIRTDSQIHVQTCVTYEVSPPVGGDHYGNWANCGFYPDRIPTQMAVHSMEHGAVWLTYDPALSAEEKALIKAAIAGHDHLIASAYDGLEHPLVLSAWNRQLPIDDLNDPRVMEFVAAYESGPQTPEPNGRCDGNAGEPEL